MTRRARIAGLGTFLPPRVVPSAEVEARCGVATGWSEARAGVRERRYADGMAAAEMGARAARAALDDAGIAADGLDLVLGASGTQPQALPDGAVFVHHALGLAGTGIAAFSVHATCLSFVAALDLAATLVDAGRYRRVLVVSADTGSVGINPDEPESALLIGDAAAAAVVVRPEPGSASCVEAARFETYSEGRAATEIRGGGTLRHPNDAATQPADNLFHMDGRAVLRLTQQRIGPFLEALRPGLSRGAPGVDLIVPHQSSAMGLRLMHGLGWPDERLVWTLPWTGNTIAAGIPFALAHAARTGRLLRGDRVLLVGTGAGLSLGGLVLTY